LEASAKPKLDQADHVNLLQCQMEDAGCMAVWLNPGKIRINFNKATRPLLNMDYIARS